MPRILGKFCWDACIGAGVAQAQATMRIELKAVCLNDASVWCLSSCCPMRLTVQSRMQKRRQQMQLPHRLTLRPFGRRDRAVPKKRAASGRLPSSRRRPGIPWKPSKMGKHLPSRWRPPWLLQPSKRTLQAPLSQVLRVCAHHLFRQAELLQGSGSAVTDYQYVSSIPTYACILYLPHPGRIHLTYCSGMLLRPPCLAVQLHRLRRLRGPLRHQRMREWSQWTLSSWQHCQRSSSRRC